MSSTDRTSEGAAPAGGAVTVRSIADARAFSSRAIQRNDLVRTDDLIMELVCFEAGQRDEEARHGGASVYQVLEGEAIVHAAGERSRLGKGKLLSVAPGVPHALENAGGGLLVVMATRSPRAS